MKRQDEESGIREELEALRIEVSQLRDLFQRRLLDDKSKNALIEALQSQGRATLDLLRRRELESLFKETLLALDRLESEPPTEALNTSVLEELLEVFRRRNLVEIEDTGEFDAQMHHAVSAVPADSRTPPNQIVAVHRRGYLLEDRVLRPAQVTISVQPDGRQAG